MINIKYKSRKFIAACWAAILLTFLSVYSIVTNNSPPWMNSLFPFLALLITVWVGGEALIDRAGLNKRNINE
jgi:hypothetical protein